MPRTYLLTGFPGFLAGRLVPRLLADDDEARIVALVEPRMVERARALAPDGVDVQPGDITDPKLGLDERTYERLTAEVVRVFHLAAVYDLAVGAELAERVNVSGTQHVVDFCRRCASLERHHYISTAYVAGTRSGLVLEEDLAKGQSFKNFYESTKFAAEVIVRASMDAIPTTIYRPAIVVGDSQTGETQKFDGPYYLLRTFAAAKGPLLQIGRGDAPFNVVPVDFVVDALAAVSAEPAAQGQTLHLVDPEPVTARELLTLLSKEYAGKEPGYKLPPRLIESSLRFKTVRDMFHGAPQESIRYLNHEVRFDTRRADDLLGRAGLRCPRFEEYVGPMVKFFREHEAEEAYVPAAVS
jgi:thioester reductase-like protein